MVTIGRLFLSVDVVCTFIHLDLKLPLYTALSVSAKTAKFKIVPLCMKNGRGRNFCVEKFCR
jgi:hypothetical protein